MQSKVKMGQLRLLHLPPPPPAATAAATAAVVKDEEERQQIVAAAAAETGYRLLGIVHLSRCT